MATLRHNNDALTLRAFAISVNPKRSILPKCQFYVPCPVWLVGSVIGKR